MITLGVGTRRRMIVLSVGMRHRMITGIVD